MGDEERGRVVRWTRRSTSIELKRRWLVLGLTYRFIKWVCRRIKPAFYHPVALIGTAVALCASLLGLWVFLTLTMLATLFVALWALLDPASYLRHVKPRIQSFKAGWRYRHRPRRKLKACGLINDDDPIPTISHVTKMGCIDRVRIKMCDGDSITMWRVNDKPARLAQTYNALECKINPYRREHLAPWKHDKVTKNRWLELDFLTKDPFNAKMGTELLDHHQDNTMAPVVAVNRSGQPHRHNLKAHRLCIAMTRWGKSNRIRAVIYAHRHNIKAGKLELWGIDGKGGVEQSHLEHVFTQVAYGDSQANPDSYNPEQFDQLLKNAVKVMKHRQRKMRGNITEHIATPDDPWLLIIVDELLILTNKVLNSDLRNSIAASIMLIQQQGIACGVSLDTSTQLAQMELLPFRKGFTEFELGKIEPGAVDMVFGTGWWERGARADEIPDDLKGTFYLKTDTTMSPEQERYPSVPVQDVSVKALGFKVGPSALWPIQRPLTAVPDQPVEEPAEIEWESVESTQPPADKTVTTTIGGFA